MSLVESHTRDTEQPMADDDDKYGQDLVLEHVVEAQSFASDGV